MKPDDLILPCGCYIHYETDNTDPRPAMVVSPCRMGCNNVAQILQAADQHDKPVTFRTGG